jgi:hypothetical protein
MPFQPNDILLAFKHIAFSKVLNGTEKQFAAFLVDSYNRKTGRCDPSEETAAHILGKSTRTIIRAGHRLVAVKFFRKRKHAGNNHCNSYEPNWEAFRELEGAYKLRRKQWSDRFAPPALSSSECQPCHSVSDSQVSSKCQVGHPSSDNVVTQTSSINSIEQTCPSNSIPSTLLSRSPNQRLGFGNRSRLGNEESDHAQLERMNSSRAAEAAASRRWNRDLLDRFPIMPTYGAIVEAIDLPMQNAATAAEMRGRGGGLSYIVSELSRRGVLQSTGRAPEGS